MPKSSAKLMAAKLNDLILSKAISKAELCRSSEISRPQLDDYLAGKHVPRLDVLDRIARAVGFAPAELIHDPSIPWKTASTPTVFSKVVQIPQEEWEHVRGTSKLASLEAGRELLRILPSLTDDEANALLGGFVDDLRASAPDEEIELTQAPPKRRKPALK